MRLINADVLKQHIDKLPALPDGNFAGNHSALKALINMQPTIQPVATDICVGDKISKFIDGLEETFAYIREREGGDSVCGLCEYDGAYIGESGDWCNECPGFNRDDCFKLSDKTRRKWTAEIIKALPSAQPEPQWIPVERELPEDFTDVLVWFEYFRYGDYNCLYQTHGIGTYVANYNLWTVNHETGWKDLRVIAWMPLPEPYKPKREKQSGKEGA